MFVVWRIWLLIPLYLAAVYLPFRDDSLFTTIWKFTDRYPVVENSAIYPWSNFDGVHYLAIASRGYVTEGRFLPLFPILVRLVAWPFSVFFGLKPFGGLIFWSGLILSNLFFFFSLVFLEKILKLDFDKKIVEKTIFALMIFPTSFFFVSIYTESLFLLLSVLALFFARKRQWVKSILFATLLSVTRLPGILILIPLVYEYLVYELNFTWKSFRKIDRGQKIDIRRFSELLKFVVIPIPLVAYSFFNYFKWGDPMLFINNHSSLGNSREVGSLVFPLTTIYRYLKIFLTVSIRQYEFWVALLEFLSLIVGVFGLVFGFKYKFGSGKINSFSKKLGFISQIKLTSKIRTSYLLFAFVLLLLPLLSGTLTGFPRYLLLAFPVFIGLAIKHHYSDTSKSRTSKLYWRTLIFLSVVLQAVLLAFFSRGWFVA